MECIQLSLFGKTCREHYHLDEKKGKTSEPSLNRSAKSSTATPMFLDLRSGQTLAQSWEMGIPSHGESSMLNTGEFPNVAVESSLSQILQASVPEKYCLSPKACLGILRRAQTRGKELPELLKKALERQAESA